MKFAAVLPLFVAAHAFGALQITNAGVRQIEDGPPIVKGTQFVPGETVYYSFEVTGYGLTAGSPPAKPPVNSVKLTYQIDAFDPKGVRIVPTVESVLDTPVSDQDKNWKPKVRSEIQLPPHAPGGHYKVAAKVTDEVSKSTALSEIEFEVNGHDFSPSPELTIRNFGFYRSEDDQSPMAAAVYKAGENLFARFDITGFRYGDRNTIEVSYDVAVLTGEGKTLYSQPHAAVEKSFSFYPKPYVPGGMNLSLQANMPKGEYTVVLTVHDVVGHQDYETKKPFRVE